MAVLKHIASKNANYGQIIEYMMFQHNELTGKPRKDEHGNMLLRDEYYIDGINCEAMSFDRECELVNEHFHKNKKREEIKSHHYIISFDPKDTDDHELTGEKAQALGIEFARKNFPGHQTLVCTHTDGHNQSGNIHVHITINSVRKLDVEPQPFMERTCDSHAGYKHHLTNDYLKHLQQAVMDMCQKENLYQVDLLSPSPKKITENEYWAGRKGQQKLDDLNQQIIADGMKPMNTRYVTQKQFLREAVEDISALSHNLEEFKSGLWEKYQIELFEKRGRFSYHHPERDKNISERTLGTDYGKAHLLEVFASNTRLQEEKTDTRSLEDASYSNITANPDAAFTDPVYFSDAEQDTLRILFIKSDLRLVINLQDCVKAQQNRAYAQKVKISNLQQMAKTIAYVQEHHFDTEENLQKEYENITEKLSEARQTVKATEATLRDINEQIHYTGQYFSGKPAFAQMLKSRNKKKFRQEHQTEIEAYESAARYLKSIHPDGKMPSMKSLKAQKEKLLLQKEAQYDTYHYFKDYQKELRTVCSNVDAILGRSQTAQKAKDHQI